ncbi:hypothetical protein SUGI_0177010 [Cryptomeria japonica]|uniref:uncharacterized protein LOC131052175 isoform X1 n=1 Tax=Cryptomeria japonica TaxID=3369 RepID=UPI0024089E51|nr:uncharacterized protein LOC131052175 isoform X1 [Cryptomeria japonica]GLJ11785.1 hypothetical protein SUGI_0177010 [Cryptomeria japonica]
MVGSVLDVIANTLFFIMEPLSMIKLLWQLCVRIVCFLTLPWFGLFKFIFNIYLDVCWRLILLGIAAFSIPIRLFTALHREKELEAHLYELQMQVEGLIGVNKDLELRLDVAIKNYRRTENQLSEAEEEEDRALEKILLLETRIREIEAENLRLREVEKRALLEAAAANNDEVSNMKEPNGNGIRKHLSNLEGEDWYGSELGDIFEKKGKILSDYLIDKGRSLPSYEKRTEGIDPLLESKMKSSGHFSFPKKQEINDVVIYQWRGAAIAQSTFSACLSLLVGMITWEAQDPCMPLVIALFIVVGMSLNSVVKFFSRIENRPGSDAVALLSFNWFILGTLASPTLPNVARLLVPCLSDFGHRMANWFGFQQ